MEFEVENLERVTPAFSRYWLDNNKIVAYRPTNSERQTVNVWFDVVFQTVQKWSNDTPYLALHDLRNATITPYSRARAMELTKFLQNHDGRTAILLPNTHKGDIIRYFVNLVLKRQKQKMKRKIFTSHDKAISWLCE